MKEYIIPVFVEFGLNMEVFDNEILDLRLIMNYTLNGTAYRTEIKVYEKPWTDYLTEEELTEFKEMQF
jgi:hypothetical protein